jgi:hypothetical protein
MDEVSGSNKKIQRALVISRTNGWSVAGFAGVCALVVILFGDVFGFLVGLAVSLSGVMELKGSRLLRGLDKKAIGWLVGSQVYLIIVLWIYALFNLVTFNSTDPWARFSPGFKDLILSINPDVYLVEALLKVTYLATYITLILVALIYQGGLCLYYLSRKKYLYAESE